MNEEDNKEDEDTKEEEEEDDKESGKMGDDDEGGFASDKEGQVQEDDINEEAGEGEEWEEVDNKEEDKVENDDGSDKGHEEEVQQEDDNMPEEEVEKCISKISIRKLRRNQKSLMKGQREKMKVFLLRHMPFLVVSRLSLKADEDGIAELIFQHHQDIMDGVVDRFLRIIKQMFDNDFATANELQRSAQKISQLKSKYRTQMQKLKKVQEELKSIQQR